MMRVEYTTTRGKRTSLSIEYYIFEKLRHTEGNTKAEAAFRFFKELNARDLLHPDDVVDFLDWKGHPRLLMST